MSSAILGQTVLTIAPGNGALIGGLKVVAESGWFAARPSGTENIFMVYAGSFRGADHLLHILEEAETIVSDALAGMPERSNGRASLATHQQTVSEAKEEWRNEEDPN
jgi:phosphoglucomutase